MSGSTGVGTRSRPPARTSRPGGPGSEAIDPRIHARRRAVRRRSSLGRRVTLIAVVLVVGLCGLAWPLTHSRLLSANALTVYGATHTGDAAVLAAAGLTTHPPMIDVNIASAARRIEALPWIARAQVERNWPDGVVVTVSERTVVAVVADGTGWAELDATGRVLSTVASPPATLPHLVSVGHPGGPGTTLVGARPSLAVAAAQTSKPKRINRAIELLEQGQPIYYTGSHSGTEGSFEQGKNDAQTWADYISYDMEHAPYDVKGPAEYMRGLD